MGFADLHIHTLYSYDGTASVQAVLQRARQLGLDIIAITDHDEIDGSLRAQELAAGYVLALIPSLEVTTAVLDWGDAPTGIPERGTDVGALAEGYISVTPLQLDLTAYRALSDLNTWQWEETSSTTHIPHLMFSGQPVETGE